MKIKNWIINEIAWIKEKYAWRKKIRKYKKDLKRIEYAKEIADLRNKADNKRYYVLRDWNGIPHALNTLEIEVLKKKGIMSKQVTIKNLLEESLYYTK